jgi:transcriptional regulator with XRE-family HTH domain
VGEERCEHVSDRFRRLLALYRKPDGSEWGGQDLENATGGAVGRSYVANLKNGRIENPGLTKLGALSGAMGLPPALWFGGIEGEGRAADDALLASLEDETLRSILEEATRLRLKDGRLLLGIARQISPPTEGG